MGLGRRELDPLKEQQWNRLDCFFLVCLCFRAWVFFLNTLVDCRLPSWKAVDGWYHIIVSTSSIILYGWANCKCHESQPPWPIVQLGQALLFFFDQLNGMRPWFYLALGVQLTDGLFKGRLA